MQIDKFLNFGRVGAPRTAEFLVPAVLLFVPCQLRALVGGIVAQITAMASFFPSCRSLASIVHVAIEWVIFGSCRSWSLPNLHFPQLFLVILLNVKGQTVGTSDRVAAALALES